MNVTPKLLLKMHHLDLEGDYSFQLNFLSPGADFNLCNTDNLLIVLIFFKYYLMKCLELLNSFHRQEKARGISNKSKKIMFLSSLTIYLIVTENVKNTWKNIFLNKAF